MRSDYSLYAVAVILFILTGIVFMYQIDYKELWIVSTTVLGFFFLGLGYSQRPKVQAKTVTVETPQPLTTIITQPEPPIQEATEAPVIVEAPVVEQVIAIKSLREVKGIGEKREGQLKAIGINTIEDLAKASAEDLASKLKVSQKITTNWIENAKKLVEKS